MINDKKTQYFAFGILICWGAISCGSQPEQAQTLGDIDTGTTPADTSVRRGETRERDVAEVKRAYYDYIEDAARSDRFRLQAATRIAELELALNEGEIQTDDTAFDESVRRTIALLEEALRDFPDAENNDHSFYQLAKAYDQLGKNEDALAALETLVARHPLSPYFAEAKFRIAEHAFIEGKYFKAEDAYTDVLRSGNNSVFLEKAFFKRGWARYKQEMYRRALDDFYQAVASHRFGRYEELKVAERELFDEYFRAIALAFSYSGGAPAIAEYHRRTEAPTDIYRTYETLANLYLKQERYSDTVATYQVYVNQHPAGAHVVDAGVRIFEVWKSAGFFSRYREAFESFYTRYSAASDLWSDPSLQDRERQQQLAHQSIREQILLLAAYHHNRYVKQRSVAGEFTAAQKWYERYLQDYQSYARQDKVYPLYAELLNQAQRFAKALHYYELAAFDGDILLDKESAYACVYLSDQLQQDASTEHRASLLDKHLRYARQYSQLYPKEQHTPSVVQNAVQLASKERLHQTVIDLADLLPTQADASVQYEIGLLKAQAYFDLQQYSDAELVYQDLLADAGISSKERLSLVDKLAMTMYKQGEEAKASADSELAVQSFLRIYHELPGSELAPAALYDGIALLMDKQDWVQAIGYLNEFKSAYPSHPFQPDVAKKLSLAYLKADRGVDAAREFERISDFSTDRDEKMAALWQAAELYYNKKQLQPALRAYKEYAHTYKRPFAENMEAMNTIIEIYRELGEREKMTFWLNRVVRDDSRVANTLKNDRTQYIAAKAAHSLAFLRKDEFDRVRLTAPLAQSLKTKKKAMQEAVKLFGQAAASGHQEFVTQSTQSIAEIYQSFAKALLDSERPSELTAEQLEQYDILLEDQAFPFEDKAIEFYEANVARIAEGVYDDFVESSLQRLKTLFPARYARPPKVEQWIEQL